MNGKWRYFFYFSGNNVSLGKKTLGVAVSESPTGPFRASAKPLFTSSAAGQMIDSDVFTDPVSGQTYLYYGNGKLCYRLLSDDMMSTIGSEYVITPSGGSLSDYAFREGAYVFYRNGLYYFLWSVDDTGATNYHVAYGTSKSPTGPIEVARQPIVIIQDPDNRIYGTGHNSIINIPGTDDWYIVYHRINPNHLNNGPGTHREVCVDRLTFNADGTIRRVTPTNRGIDPVVIPNVEEMITGIHGIGQPESANWTGEATGVAYYTADGTRLGTQAPHLPGLYLRREVLPTGEVRTLKMVVK
jgi:beta-xylosidase